MLEARISLALNDAERVLSVSDEIEALLGFTRDDFLSGGVALRKRIHPDDSDIAERLFTIDAGPVSGSCNVRLRHADGRIRCIKAEYARPAGESILNLLLQDARNLARSANGHAMLANFKAMMEITDDFIYFKDRNHVFTGASQTLVSITDPSEHWTDLLGQTDYDVFPEAYADIYYRLEKQVFAGSPAAQEIQAYLTNDGRKGWVDNRKYPILDDNKEIVGLFGIARDITDRVLAEDALRASESKFHSLYASMTEGVALHQLLCDAAGKPVDYLLTDVNPAFETILGLSRQAVLGRPASEVFGTGEAPYLEIYAAVATSGRPERFSASFEPMGKAFSISVFSPAQGQFATVFKDITEERRLEAALRDSEQRYRTFASGSFEGVAMAAQGRIVDANDQLLKMLGYTRDELIGQEIACLMPDDVRERVMSNIREGLESRSEHRMIRKDGSHILVESRGVTVEIGGRATRLATIRDITAIRAVEEKSRESEARFRRMFEHNSSIMLLISPESGDLLDANAAAAGFYGYSIAQLKTMNVRDLNALSQAALVAEMADAKANRRNVFEFEHRLASGEIRAVEVRSSPIQADGRPVLFSIINDITERRQAERALKESEQRFRQLFDHADSLAIQGYTADGTVAYWNRTSEMIYGYSAAEAIGANLLDLIIPEAMRSQVEAGMKWMFETGQGIPSGRLVLRHKLGHGVPVYSSHTIVKVDGQPPILFCLDTDLGDLERAEGQVRQLSEAVAQNPNGILITDTEGRIEYVNAAFCEASGYGVDEVRGQLASFIGSDSTPPAVYESLWAAIGAGRIWRGEFINRRKDGSEQVVFAHVAPIRELDGRISHYVAIHDDITEKKRDALELERYRHHLEELLSERSGDLIRANAELVRARDAAEAASRAKSVFLANMSHELRTPMSAIIGMTDLAMRRAVDPRQIDQLGKVGGASRQLLGIINDVLDVAKIEAEQFILEQAEFSLPEVFKRLVDLLGQTASNKGLQLNIDVPSVLLAQSLRGDPLRVSQIFVNLTSNAIKFTSQGSISVSVRVEQETPSDLLLRCQVKDTGIGIAAEDQQRLFAAFVQVDASMTRKYGGTGLGLAISKKLTEMMGGQIGVDSQPGAGSTFWFTMRLLKALPSAAEAVPSAGTASAEETIRYRHIGKRILLAEDEPVNQEVSTGLLEAAGLVVDLAEDGEQALRMAEQSGYDLILMDMQMPRLNGLEATQAIRRQPGSGRIPIIAMTANAFEEDRQRCLAAGMNDFISKPVEPDLLFETILKWLSKSEPGSSDVSNACLMQ